MNEDTKRQELSRLTPRELLRRMTDLGCAIEKLSEEGLSVPAEARRLYALFSEEHNRRAQEGAGKCEGKKV